MSSLGLLFDLDGTLVDTERESAEAMARALESGQGVSVTQEDRDAIIGRSWVDIHRDLASRYPVLRWSMAELIEETSRVREKMLAETGLEPLPGARAVLERFAHVPKAVVTGSSRAEAEHALELLGVRSSFIAVFAAEDVPTSKPHPAGYRLAAEAIAVEAGRCVVIEDSAAGIAAGRAAGARVIAVRAGNFADQDQSGADLVLETLAELTDEVVGALVGDIAMVPGTDRD